jgi:hypothetical protein
VAGVHGLQHVEGLAATALADDDPIGPHTQGVAHQIADGHLALALDVRWTRFQNTTCSWRSCSSLESSMVTMRSSSGIKRRQDIQEGRLAGVGPAGHDDVQAAHHAGFDEAGEGRGEGAVGDQVLDQQGLLGELPDGEKRDRRWPGGGSRR